MAPGIFTVKQQGRHLLTQHQGGADKERAGQHSQHKSIHTWLEPSMIQVNVELSSLDLFENTRGASGEDLEQMFEVDQRSSQSPPMSRRR